MSESTTTRRRWFQLTISRILWATFWMAICFGVTAAWGWHEFEHWLPVIAVITVVGLCPFIALGTLCGRPFIGLMVGVVVVGIYCTVAVLKMAG